MPAIEVDEWTKIANRSNAYQPTLAESKRVDAQSSLNMGTQSMWPDYSEMQQKLQLSSKKQSAAKEEMKKANSYLMKNNNQPILMYSEDEDDGVE